MKKILTVLALSTVLSANADNTNLGAIPSWGSYIDKHNLTASFDDTYTFSTYDTLMDFTIESGGIKNLKVSLNGTDFETDKTKSTFYWDSEKVSKVEHLDSGPYTLRVRGETYSGDYWGHISVTPVPEPEQWLMLLVGLGIITRKYKYE